VQLLLEHGTDVNTLDKDHWILLHSASYYEKPKLVRVFLNHDAKANTENDNGGTPLSLVSQVEYPSQASVWHSYYWIVVRI
jgi:ankyrin repeat protein